MRNYELALAISAKIEDAQRAEVLEKAKGYVTRYEGNILGIEQWGRKRLAYEIQHQTEAFFYFIHFEAEPTTPALLETDVRIMDNVLRYLIVSEEEYVPAEEPAVEEAPAAEEIPAAAEEAEEAAAPEAPAEEAAAPEAPAEEAPAEEPAGEE